MAEDNATITTMAKALKEGESVSRSHRIPMDEYNPKSARRTMSKMRNSMNQLIGRVREATERAYRMDSGQFITHDGTALIMTVAVTCVEDEGEDDI